MIVGSNILAGASGQQGYFLNRSVRTRSSASAYFNRTPVSATNRKTFTWSGWVKRGILGSAQALIESGNGSGIYTLFWFSSSDQIQLLQDNGGGGVLTITTNAVFRDPSAWYHIVIAIDTTQATANNRTIIYVNGINQLLTYSTQLAQNADTWINFTYQHRLDGRTSGGSYFDGYTTEINFIDGQALTPTSFGEYNTITGVWQPKKYGGTYGTNGFYLPFNNLSTTGGNGFSYSEDFTNAAWTKYQSTITANAIVAPNGTTTADKLIETATTGDHQVTRTFAATDNTAYTLSAYAKAGERSNFRLYLQNKAGTYNYADFDLSNGVIIVTSGVTAVITNVGNSWYRCSVSSNVGTGGTASPAAILSYATISAGSGTNGLYIWGAQIEGSTSVVGAYYSTTTTGFGTFQIGADQSLPTGGYNSWVANNISLTAGVTYDSMTDVPTLTSATTANYSTLNPLNIFAVNIAAGSVSNGNLRTQSAASANAYQYLGSTISAQSGTYYFEATLSQVAGSIYPTAAVGWAINNTSSALPSTYVQVQLYTGSGSTILVNGATVQSGLATITNGDIIGVAFDATNLTCQFYKNGVTLGTQITGLTSGSYQAIVTPISNGSASTSIIDVNFGQRPFTYTPPTGFKALNTYNLPTPTIANGANQFAATTYTGNGTTQTITNGGNNTIGKTFQPDLAWIKVRSITGQHVLTDSIRGVDKQLFSSLTNAEQTSSSGITSFNSNGFGLGSGVSPVGSTNENSQTYIAWQWKASNAAAVTNTSGSISSQVSANPSAGFSIVTFTTPASGNFTVGHGLGIAPAMFILKTRSGVDGWYVYHKNLATPASNYLVLNTTAATATSTSIWGNTNPTSSVLTLGTNAGIAAGATGLLYCFLEIAGYSKFGSYTGNGSTDGTFVYTGFRPRWVMIKRTDTTSNWVMFDTSRNISNVAGAVLYPNLSDAEGSLSNIDILSNGFKFRAAGTNYNASGGTYIYAAFAENPFNYSLAR